MIWVVLGFDIGYRAWRDFRAGGEPFGGVPRRRRGGLLSVGDENQVELEQGVS